MDHTIEYSVYSNLYTYLKVIGFTPVEAIKTRSDFVNTVQFYSHIKIKALKDKLPLYIFLAVDEKYTSRSAECVRLLNMVEEKEARVIIVGRNDIKPSVKKAIHKYTKKKIDVFTYTFTPFKVDPRQCSMVPVHKLCTDEETKQILLDNHISLNQLPKIKKADPQVIWVGGSVGQVVKIIRNNVTSMDVYYRVIIA